MGYAINTRPYFPDTSSFYILNAFIAATIFFPSMEKFQSLNQAQMALYIHQNVQAYTQPSVIRKILQFWEEIIEKRLSVIPTPPDSNLDAYGFVSSWTTFRFDHLNLKGAMKNIAGNANGDDKIGRGQCVFTQPWVYLPAQATVRPACIIMKDQDKGYWLRANNTVQNWKAFDSILEDAKISF